MYRILNFSILLILNNVVVADVNLYLTKTDNGSINATCIDTTPEISSALLLINSTDDSVDIVTEVTTLYALSRSNLKCEKITDCFDDSHSFEKECDPYFRVSNVLTTNNNEEVITDLDKTDNLYISVLGENVSLYREENETLTKYYSVISLSNKKVEIKYSNETFTKNIENFINFSKWRSFVIKDTRYYERVFNTLKSNGETILYIEKKKITEDSRLFLLRVESPNKAFWIIHRKNSLFLHASKSAKSNKFEVFTNSLCIMFRLHGNNELFLNVTAERNNQNFTETVLTPSKYVWENVKINFKFPDSNKSKITLIFALKNIHAYGILHEWIYVTDLKECIYDYKSINALLKPETTNISCQKLNTNYFVSNTSIRSISKCAPGYFGQYCDISCGGYFGKQHEHCKGVLMCGHGSCSCAARYTGEYCQQEQIILEENGNNTVTYILIVLLLLLIFVLIPTICILRIKYKKIKYMCTSKREFIDVKKKETKVFSEIYTSQIQGPEYQEGYSNKRSETNEVNVNQQSATKPTISELKSIVHVVNKTIEPEQFPNQQNEQHNYEEIKEVKAIIENKSTQQNDIDEININHLDSNLEHVALESHLKYVNVGVNVNSKGQPIYDEFSPKQQSAENKYVYDYVEAKKYNII